MLYDYTCKCGKQFERIVKYEDRDKQKCECGKKATRAEISACNFHLKGSGFYSTDNKKASRLTKSKINKMDNEQKLALAANLIEKTTGKDLQELADKEK